jgi:phospholipid transport system substrate-binding protein
MSTIQQPDGHPIAVNWRVSGTPGHYRITDVVVDGVSMVITQRQEFASVIEDGGGSITTLITQLREKVHELSQ